MTSCRSNTESTDLLNLTEKFQVKRIILGCPEKYNFQVALDVRTVCVHGPVLAVTYVDCCSMVKSVACSIAHCMHNDISTQYIFSHKILQQLFNDHVTTYVKTTRDLRKFTLSMSLWIYTNYYIDLVIKNCYNNFGMVLYVT